MLDNHRFLAIAITVSIIGVLGLYFYATSISPEEMAIADIGEDDIGSLVRLNGTIKSTKTLEDGSASLELVDVNTNASIVIYIHQDRYEEYIMDNPGHVIPGAVFEFTGTIEEYQGAFELVVSSSDWMTRLADAGGTMTSAHQLLDSPDLYDGMTVRVGGTLESPYLISDANGTKGMGFELEEIHDNRTYRLTCVVFDDDMIGDYETGSLVEVVGTFQYYAGTGSWQVMMDDENDVLVLP